MKFIKLLLSFIGICALSVPLTACEDKTDYFSYVSELRTNIYTAENQDVSISIYCGAQESPAIFDGVKNDTRLTLCVKAIFTEEPSQNTTVTVSYDDKEYVIPIEFHPVKRALAGKTEVSTLPTEKQIQLTVNYGETSFSLTAVSKLNDDTITYTDALSIAAKNASEFIKENTVSGILQAEITVRLLVENDKNYYFVGFITEEGLKKAYLIDGTSGEIVATKDN